MFLEIYLSTKKVDMNMKDTDSYFDLDRHSDADYIVNYFLLKSSQTIFL